MKGKTPDSVKKYFRIPSKDVLYTRIAYLQTVRVVEQEPFMYISVDENGTEHYEGFCIDMIQEMSEMLGFDYHIYPAPDNFFGAPDEKGRWSGLIQELISKVCKPIYRQR